MLYERQWCVTLLDAVLVDLRDEIRGQTTR